MFEFTLVPHVEICGWLIEHGWNLKTHHEWRKYSLNEKPILLQVSVHDNIDVMTLSGKEEYRYPAPTARELIDALPSDIFISKALDGDYYVRHEFAPNQSVFKLKSSLEDALAELWILLKMKEES